MAVALATLPLKSVLAGAGDTCLTTGAGAGVALVAGLATGLTATFAGLLAGLATGLAIGFATTLAADLTGAAAFVTGARVADFAVTFLTLWFLALVVTTAAFLATGFLTTAFLTAAFFVASFLTDAGLLADFLAGLAFFGGALAATFLGAGLAVDFFTVAGLDTTFPAAALLADLLAGLVTAFFAGVLLTLFTVRPFVAAVFGLPAPASRALAGVFPFCALVAVELRVVFAISLHRFWP